MLVWNWKNFIINLSQRRQKSLNLRVWTKENFKPDTIKIFRSIWSFRSQSPRSANNKTDGQLESNEIRACNCLLWLLTQLSHCKIPLVGRAKSLRSLAPAACGLWPTLMDIWHPALTQETQAGAPLIRCQTQNTSHQSSALKLLTNWCACIHVVDVDGGVSLV